MGDLLLYVAPAGLSRGVGEWIPANFDDLRFRRAVLCHEPLRPEYALFPGTECDVQGRHVCATIPLIHWARRHQ